MASIYKRGDTWWISYRVWGKTVSKSLNTRNAREASELKKHYEAQKTNGLLPKPTSTRIGPLLEALCEFWLRTRKSKGARTDIGRLRNIFGVVCPALKLGSHTPKKFRVPHEAAVEAEPAAKAKHLVVRTLEDITPEAIRTLLHDRVASGEICGKTANKIRSVLSSMFAYAKEYHGYVCPDPDLESPAEAVKRFEEQNNPIVWLKAEEITQQLAVLAGHKQIRAMVAVCIYAGLRRSETLWLTKDDVDLKGRVLRIRAKEVNGEQWEPKTGKERTVPISEKLSQELEAYLPLQKGLWFFGSDAGSRWDQDYFSECLREINVANGLPWSCAEYRHTFGSLLAQKGVSLYKISSLMGNGPEICRKHYAALMPGEMHDEVEF